jgi:hypothetical protein
MAIRIDDNRRARIARAARRQGKSPSEAVRHAIDRWLEEEEASGSPYERMADLIGTVDGGPSDLSSQGGRRVAEMLKARQESSK